MATTSNPTWIDFNANFGETVDPELALDVTAIQNSIENILSTPIGSRPMQRDYGSKLYFFIHEPMDRITEEDIRVSIIQAIEKWEPRVVIDNSKTSVKKLSLDVGYSIEVYFTLLLPKIDSSIKFNVRRMQ